MCTSWYVVSMGHVGLHQENVDPFQICIGNVLLQVKNCMLTAWLKFLQEIDSKLLHICALPRI